MKKLISILSILLFVFLTHIKADNLFYYGLNSTRNELIPLKNKVAFQKDIQMTKDEFIKNLSQFSKSYSVEWKWDELCVIETQTEADMTELKETLMHRCNNVECYFLYKVNNNLETILFSEIVIKPKASNALQSIVKDYQMELKEDNGRFQVYSLPKDSDVIKISNKIYETGKVEFAYPRLLFPVQKLAYYPNDTYFQYQIACHNIGQMLPNGHTGTVDADINAPEAWDITKGSSNVIIAVYDEGVTSNHPDLPNQRQVRLPGSNFGYGSPDFIEATGEGNHGNACAGVIAATMDNNQGIAGIAPNCKIMPVRWDISSDEFKLASGLLFAVNHGANIISCSWGIEDTSTTLSPAIIDAIEYAIEQNVVVIFAAGNTANHIAGNNGYVMFPANANIENLITIGASDRYDHVAVYSPKSPLIDFVAPAHRAYRNQIATETFEMWTLDIPGEEGYNPVPFDLAQEVVVTQGTTLPSSGTNYLAYTGYFGGTSHSCPVVAGVVALMLSVNPNLTPAEIYEILKATSAKVGGYTYTLGRCNEMGYGRVDAYEAVLEAAGGNIRGLDYVCDTSKYYLLDVQFPSYTVNWTLTNPSSAIFNYTFVGPTNTDTVLVACTYTDPPFILLNEHDSTSLSHSSQSANRGVTPKLNSTISSGATSKTYTKSFRSPAGDIPTVIPSSTGTWYSNTPRTFTITNCLDVPDDSLTWTIVKTQTNPVGPPPHPITLIRQGRSTTYSTEVPYVGTCTVTVTATNPLKECEPKSTTLTYTIVRRKQLLANLEDGTLNVLITNGDNSPNENAENMPLSPDNTYALELWHSVYGRMHTSAARSASEQINVSGLPQGVYTLLLKENDNTIAQTKVQIY